MKKTSIGALLTAVFATGASSFCINHDVATRSTQTALHLLPTHGKQLAAAAAAYNAALAKERQEDGPSLEEHTLEATPTNAGRHFVAKLFSLPSRLNKHKSFSVPELASIAAKFDTPYKPRGEEKDVVLYPITGFRWVKVKNGQEEDYKVLPTTANAAINLPSSRHEELVGWYSPVCMLGSVHSLEDSDYCWERQASTTSTLP